MKKNFFLQISRVSNMLITMMLMIFPNAGILSKSKNYFFMYHYQIFGSLTCQQSIGTRRKAPHANSTKINFSPILVRFTQAWSMRHGQIAFLDLFKSLRLRQVMAKNEQDSGRGVNFSHLMCWSRKLVTTWEPRYDHFYFLL